MQFFTGLNRIYSETGFMKEQRKEKNGLYSRDELENIIKKYGDSVYRLAYLKMKIKTKQMIFTRMFS